jgi:prophage maintenance system killer protein
MGSLHYLTVQDILWINLQATKKVHHFNHARLEEATYYQYAYGESKSLLPQAGRFLSGFLKMRPFEAGNEVTAFIGCAAFLRINGMKLNLTDDRARDWFAQIPSIGTGGADAVASIAIEDPEHHPTLRPDIRSAIKSVLEEFPCTVLHLATPAAVSA